MTQVIKRDGAVVPFNKQKIIDAINKAFLEVDGKLYESDTATDIANDIYVSYINKAVSVESIQDLVEEYLMRSERKDVARAYVRYRYKKEVARNHTDDFILAIGEKIKGSNIENQNANVDEHSFGGRYGEAADLLMKKYALDFCVSKKVKYNHINNRIYIHDLSAYPVGSHNCLSVPFDHLLANGFNTRQADIRPANSVNTAFQLVAVIFQLQSLQQFGGVSATHLDWTMVPYVRKSFRKHWNDGAKWIGKESGKFPDHWKNVEKDLPINEYPDYDDCASVYYYALEQTEKETQQAVEGMYHNLNTLQSRSGN